MTFGTKYNVRSRTRNTLCWTSLLIFIISWVEQLHKGSCQSITEVCENGALFTFVEEALSFDDANAFCRDEGLGTLARIGSLEEYNTVLQLKGTIGIAEDFWIGMLSD